MRMINLICNRIHFGIYHENDIKWPNRCLWCGSRAEKLHKIHKKSMYDFEYRVFWINILSRVKTIYYPVCKKHNYFAFLLFPSKLFWFFIFLLILIMPLPVMIQQKRSLLFWVFYALFVVGFIYYRKHSLIIHRVNEHFTEISLPDGDYANDFGLLNNCNKIKGHLLMQELIE
jgi:hypothetical protein